MHCVTSRSPSYDSGDVFLVFGSVFIHVVQSWTFYIFILDNMCRAILISEYFTFSIFFRDPFLKLDWKTIEQYDQPRLTVKECDFPGNLMPYSLNEQHANVVFLQQWQQVINSETTDLFRVKIGLELISSQSWGCLFLVVLHTTWWYCKPTCYVYNTLFKLL